MNGENSSDILKFEVKKLRVFPDLSFKGGYRRVYRLAKDFLREWRNNEKNSPALRGEKVRISNKVFKHLIGKTQQSNYTDALSRLRQIPNAKQILETVDDIFDKTVKSSFVTVYALLGQLESGRFLKVIVEKDTKTKINKLISLYEVTGNFYSILTHCLEKDQLMQLQDVFKKPVEEMELKSGQRISGWLLSAGKISEVHYKIILYSEKRLVLLDLDQTRLENLKPGVRITIQAIDHKKLIEKNLSNGLKK